MPSPAPAPLSAAAPRWSPLLLAVVLGVAVTALVFVTANAHRTYSALANSVDARQSSLGVLTAMRRLRRRVAEIRLAQASYAQTGDPAYRQTFDDALAALDNDTIALRALSRDEPDRMRALDRIVPLLHDYADSMRAAIGAPGRPRAAPRTHSPDVLLLNQIRPAFESFDTAETRRMDAHAAAIRDGVARSNTIITWGLGVVVVLIVVGGGAVSLQLYRRELAEARLGQTQDLLLAVLDGTSDAIFIKDLEGRYEMINRAGAEALGAPPHEILGATDDLLLDPEAAAQTRTHDRAVRASGATATADETLLPRGGAAPRLWMSTRGLLKDAKGTAVGLFGISRDITERQRLEMQVRQSQKMEAVGQLAGGIAHDFNNLLAAITSFADLLLMDGRLDEQQRADTQDIRRAAQQAAALTRQLLAYSRRQMLRPQLLNVNSALGEDERLLRRTLGEHIDLRFVFDPGAQPVLVDPGQLSQIVLNLAINARDAMPGGGRLTFETANTTLDESYAALHAGVTPGEYLMLAVTDTGHGMDAETQRRIFEPFFTTKAERGTGLGLATVHGIIAQSGGHIWVYSEPGRGTTFKIYLPIAARTSPEVAAATLPVSRLSGTETVLVCEDAELVRHVAVRILSQSGYTVLEAPRPQDAIGLCQTHGGPIDLILTDIVMPQMSGPQLVERAMVLRPRLRVVYMSGYADGAVVHQGVLADGVPFLAKPFSPEDMLRRVRAALDAV